MSDIEFWKEHITKSLRRIDDATRSLSVLLRLDSRCSQVTMMIIPHSQTVCADLYEHD